MDKGLNIYQRILAVMADVSYVAKGDKKVNNQYTFVSHDAVTACLHPMFVRHGIAVIPTVVSSTQNGNRTEVELVTRFYNADDPQDFFGVTTFGYGIDAQDKGPGKAVSYAYKYALLKVFALETGDDPERDALTNHNDQEPGASHQMKTQSKSVGPDWGAWFAGFETDLAGVTTEEERIALRDRVKKIVGEMQKAGEKDIPQRVADALREAKERLASGNTNSEE